MEDSSPVRTIVKKKNKGKENRKVKHMNGKKLSYCINQVK